MISHVAFIALNLVSFDWIDSIGEFIHARLAGLLILIPHALGTRPPTGSISVQGRPGGDLMKEGRLTSPHQTSRSLRFTQTIACSQHAKYGITFNINLHMYRIVTSSTFFNGGSYSRVSNETLVDGRCVIDALLIRLLGLVKGKILKYREVPELSTETEKT